MRINWTDWAGVAIYAVIALALFVGLVALLVWDARRRKSPSVLLDVVASLARIWVAVVVLGVFFTAIQWIWSEAPEVRAIPVSVAWPTMLPCWSGDEPAPAGTATLACAGVDTAWASVAGLDAGLRIMLGLGDSLTLLVTAVPGVLIASFAQRASDGPVFATRTSRRLMACAVFVLVAGSAGSVLTQVGSALTAQLVLPASGSGAAVTAASTVGFDPPYWPLGVALGLAALSVVFRQGARLQRDTEGLV
jgi:hypothetical protein